LPGAGDEFLQSQFSASSGRREFNTGVKRQQRWHTVSSGRSIAKVARDCAGVLNLDATDLTSGQLETVE
jgi:hypothetical protein